MHIFVSTCQLGINKDENMFPERTYCVRGLFKAKSRVNFRSTKVDAAKLKRKYLNRPWSTLAVKVVRLQYLNLWCHIVW
jgi:hypothetical protein